MAYTKLNLKLGRGSYNSKNSESTLTTHTYKSDNDDFVAITTANYFPSNLDQPIDIVKLNDLMQIQDSTNEERVYVISSLSPFQLTLDSGNLQEEKLLFQTAFGGVFSSPINTTIELGKIGTLVHAGWKALSGTAVSPVVLSSTIPIPVPFLPSVFVGPTHHLTKIIDNGVDKDGMIEVLVNGNMNIYTDSSGASFAGAGTSGYDSFYMTWVTD